MEAPDESEELIRRGNELIAQSLRRCEIAAEKMAKSRELITASVRVRQAMLRGRGWEPSRAQREK